MRDASVDGVNLDALFAEELDGLRSDAELWEICGMACKPEKAF